ncbi:hypothetical protein [Robiginitalea sp. IMCC43444]|uniref:hypothetical protein n=1 Tax=Robiginitalea sp. IMCC43444 TaxID=3459121 RepID=UPI0040430AA3
MFKTAFWKPIKLVLIIGFIIPSAFGQITFEKSENQEINIGRVGNINAFVRELGTDKLSLRWIISDLQATGSDNIFMAYETETHNIEFEASYEELNALSDWMEERQKSKTGGSVMLGEWKVTYAQSALGMPQFNFEGTSGSFVVAFSSEMRKRLMQRRYLEEAIEDYKTRQAKEAEREAKRKAREERRKSKNKEKG